MMKTLRALIPLALATVAAVGCVHTRADLTGPAPFTNLQAEQLAPVSLTVERPGGSTFPAFFHLGSLYVAGDFGSRYNLRLSNNTNERVEAVVTVDGRDVISGELGNFKQQRGYIIEPFDSVVVEGFRQSYDHVAAFRFTDLGDSYSARRGSPQHAGVIGVAVFTEKQRRERRAKSNPISTRAPRFPSDVAAGEPFPDSPSADERDVAGAAQEREESDSAPLSKRDRGFSQPAPRNELGTEFGEDTFSQVFDVEFKRRRKRRPDAILTLHYDSARGLAARGVPVGIANNPPAFVPQTFAVDRGFAPPPR